MSNKRLFMSGKKKGSQLPATMTVAKLRIGKFTRAYGFASSDTPDADVPQGGSISPTPLPNGITVTNCYYYSLKNSGIRITPADVTGVTINGTKMKRGDNVQSVYDYLSAHVNSSILIIFHFD